eukprot:g6827.t1
MTKWEVKEYLTKIYNVPVKKVMTQNFEGKRKRIMGKRSIVPYKRPNFKKAILRRRVAQKHEGSNASTDMAASAQSARGMGGNNHITISPATSNEGVKFTSEFDQVFGSSTLHAAFEHHPAFKAVFTSKPELQRRTRSRSGPNDAKKSRGRIIATSTESATATDKAGLARVKKGLISAIMTAYNTHCNLVISPDDVWLTVLGQFCAYVNNNANGLRNRIVDHDGEKKLAVSCDGTLHAANYPRLISDLLGQIRQNIKSPELADWFRPGFSTTTERDEVCAAATAMASLQAYFEYRMMLKCGIPSVTLMGTVADWKLLREKIERLLEFEVDGNPEGKVMEIWVGYLRKVCDGFVESAEHPGSPETLDFWDKVLSHVSHGSGMDYITGWVSAFTCFDEKGKFLGRSTKFLGFDEKKGSVEKNGDFPRIRSSKICHNVVSCPVRVDDNGREYDAALFSGQTVCEAERPGETGHPTVRPRNDWCLAVAMKG